MFPRNSNSVYFAFWCLLVCCFFSLFLKDNFVFTWPQKCFDLGPEEEEKIAPSTVSGHVIHSVFSLITTVFPGGFLTYFIETFQGKILLLLYVLSVLLRLSLLTMVSGLSLSNCAYCNILSKPGQ